LLVLSVSIVLDRVRPWTTCNVSNKFCFWNSSGHRTPSAPPGKSLSSASTSYSSVVYNDMTWLHYLTNWFYSQITSEEISTSLRTNDRRINMSRPVSWDTLSCRCNDLLVRIVCNQILEHYFGSRGTFHKWFSLMWNHCGVTFRFQ